MLYALIYIYITNTGYNAVYPYIRHPDDRRLSYIQEHRAPGEIKREDKQPLPQCGARRNT